MSDSNRQFKFSNTILAAAGLVVIAVVIAVVAFKLWEGAALMGEAIKNRPIGVRGRASSSFLPITALVATFGSLAFFAAAGYTIYIGIKEGKAERKRASQTDDRWKNMPFPKDRQ